MAYLLYQAGGRVLAGGATFEEFLDDVRHWDANFLSENPSLEAEKGFEEFPQMCRNGDSGQLCFTTNEKLIDAVLFAGMRGITLDNDAVLDSYAELCGIQ